MAQIYQGCMAKKADGTNTLIGPGKKCLVPTDECLWKDPRGIKNARLKQKTALRRTYCEH